jgi:hypothetical protein
LRTVLVLMASNIFMKEPLKLDYFRVALCMVGAVYFIFRGA